jgi:hypothetical protein
MMMSTRASVNLQNHLSDVKSFPREICCGATPRVGCDPATRSPTSWCIRTGATCHSVTDCQDDVQPRCVHDGVQSGPASCRRSGWAAPRVRSRDSAEGLPRAGSFSRLSGGRQNCIPWQCPLSRGLHIQIVDERLRRKLLATPWAIRGERLFSVNLPARIFPSVHLKANADIRPVWFLDRDIHARAAVTCETRLSSKRLGRHHSVQPLTTPRTLPDVIHGPAISFHIPC